MIGTAGALITASIMGERKIRNEVQGASEYIPGFEYADEYAIHGILESYQRDEFLRSHDIDIKNWSEDPENKFPPKLKELIRLGYLTEEKALALRKESN